MRFGLALKSAVLAMACSGVFAACAQAGKSAPLQVAFTFDDLPAHGPLPPGEPRPAVVRSILKTFAAEHMPPTYGFINGFRVAQYPYQMEILKAWHDAGQPLGNHTWSHPSLDHTAATKYEANIARNEAMLKKVDPDGDWHWFRYPYLEEGETDAKHNEVHAWLTEHHYRVAEVTIDFEDYAWNDVYARCAVKHEHNAAAFADDTRKLHDSYLEFAGRYIDYSRDVSRRLYGRDIPYVLLLHVGAFDAKMLPELIALYRSRGFTFVTLPQAQSDPAYAQDPGVAYPGGGLLTEVEASKRKVDTPDVEGPDKMLDAMCK